MQEVCRIPSVLGDEGALADVPRLDDAGVGVRRRGAAAGAARTAPTPIGRGRASEPGRRVVLTGHMDTKPVSHGWSVTEPFSGALIDGSVYGHGVMDMKAALACQIVAIEAVRASGLAVCAAPLAMAAVSDHMGDQLGSIAYFDDVHGGPLRAGRAHRQPGLPGAPRPLLLRRHHAAVAPRTRATSRRRSTPTSWRPRPSWRSTPRSTSPIWSRGSSTCSAPRPTSCPDGSTAVCAPGGPSMIPDECVIRVDCRPQPGVTIEQVRDGDRPLPASAPRTPTRASAPTSCSPT